MSAPDPSSVAPSITALHAGVLGAMILALAFEEKLHAKKSVITGLAAVVALLAGAATGILPQGHGHVPLYIPFIDWGVIAVILGSSLFVDVSSKSGIFSWLAIRLTKASEGDPLRLLWTYGILTVLFSALLNNVTAMIIIGSLTAVSLRKLERSDLLLAFLLTEGLLTNIGGLLTLVSSVPNILVGTTAGISFMKFFVVSAPYVAGATALTLWFAARRFSIRPNAVPATREEAARRVAAFDENDGIESKGYFLLCWILFGSFIVALASTPLIPGIRELGIGFVAMAFGVSLLVRVRAKADQTYARLDWDLLFFFCFLFVVIGVAEQARVLETIGDAVVALMRLGRDAGPAALLWASAAGSSITDNIPLAAMLAKTMGAIDSPAPLPSDSPFWWAVIYGANLGGNLTPIGSASTVMALTVIHRNGLKLPFLKFVKAALPFAILQLVLATAYVWILSRWG